jgi:hypothetical protein
MDLGEILEAAVEHLDKSVDDVEERQRILAIVDDRNDRERRVGTVDDSCLALEWV